MDDLEEFLDHALEDLNLNCNPYSITRQILNREQRQRIIGVLLPGLRARLPKPEASGGSDQQHAE